MTLPFGEYLEAQEPVETLPTEVYSEEIDATSITAPETTRDEFYDNGTNKNTVDPENDVDQLDRIQRADLVRLTIFSPVKSLGGLTLRTDERIPVSGWDPDAGEYGLHIPSGSRRFTTIHVDEIRGRDQAEQDLRLAGTYVNLHPELRERSHIVGVTFEPLARMAVQHAGFSYIPMHGDLTEDFRVRLENAYARTSMSHRQPLQAAMVQIPTEAFVERFADGRVGSDVNSLRAMLIEKYDIY